jgi:repressor LexA
MTTRRRQPTGDRGYSLTPRRREILGFIREASKRSGYSPSMQEIADAVGLKSVSTVSYHMETLEEMGYLTRGAGMPRTVVRRPPGFRVIQQSWNEAGEAPVDYGSHNMVGVPMFERITAGYHPVVANSECVGMMWVSRELTGSGALFAIKVAGDSMINANIFDGDYVVVRQQQVADNGDIVAALIAEEEATVKTFYRVDGHVWLMPQNPSYEPMLGDHCHIMGKVVMKIPSV